MQGGIWIDGRDPKSKAEVKRAFADNREVIFYDTSAFSNFGSRKLSALPDGNHTIVGPNPYTKRNFYGTITKRGDSIKIS